MIQQIKSLFDKTKAIEDRETQSHWARYICVRCSGLLEKAILELYGDYAETRASEGVAGFVKQNLSHIYTPKQQRFLEIAERFNPEWKDTLEQFLNEDGRGEAIDSIINIRNSVAHGGEGNITIATLKTYFEKSIKVLDFIENQCNT